ncbi:hypothetical protein GGI21_006300 [Coemansia aciculifera]|nr:hypothetical protein GGI21_006300 [Coemansia aciculifera]
MNEWTALHWACARSQAETVEILIRAGANTDLKNSKGELAYDVCKSDEIRALFPNHGSTASRSVATLEEKVESEFVPNYLVNPDLVKAWGMPEDVLPGTVVATQSEPEYMRQREIEAPVASTGKSNNERELLVYQEQIDEASLLGSVFVSDNEQTIAALGDVIREELDGVPDSFSLARYNGKLTVPVSAKQEAFNVGRIFRGADDAVVLKNKAQEP